MAYDRIEIPDSELVLRRGRGVMKTGSSSWTFLSNHGHVLICLAKQPDARLRDVVIAVRADEAGHRDRNHEFADKIAAGER